MTLEEMREACARMVEAHGIEDDLFEEIADAIRAIPLPAPVDDDDLKDLERRTAETLRRVRDGLGLRRIPADPSDVDVVLHDWSMAAERLRRERDEARRERDAATVVAINDGQALLTLRAMLSDARHWMRGNMPFGHFKTMARRARPSACASTRH